MAKYDIFCAKCISPMAFNDNYQFEKKRYFILKHNENLISAQLLIQRYLKNKCGLEDIVISVTSTPLEGYNTYDIPESLIAQMNGIYNLSHEKNN